MVRLLGGLVLYLSTLYCGPKPRTGAGRGREGAGVYPELAVLGDCPRIKAFLDKDIWITTITNIVKVASRKPVRHYCYTL